jgi:hypothetical protein
MRARLRDTLSRAARDGVKRVVIYGTGELAEMAYLSLREMGMILVGFVDDGQQDSFLSYPVWRPETLTGWEFDAILLADLEKTAAQKENLDRHHIPDAKILALGPVA